MFGWKILVLAAAGWAHPNASQPPEDGGGGGLQADSALLAETLTGRELRLTMRGTTVTVMASAAPAEDGCAAHISAQARATDRKWSRLFRWTEVAWTGSMPEGATVVSFFEEEGRLPVDRVMFSPEDGASFREALGRVTGACRALRGDERVTIAGQGVMRGCYFARLPGLRLMEPVETDRPRAMLTVLSRETPEAELQLTFERSAPVARGGSDEWGRPSVAFTFADPRLKDVGMVAASFALDAKPVAAEHALTLYGDTRVRIGMDPFSGPAAGKRQPGYYRRLAASSEARLTLLDGQGQSHAVLHFDTGPVLAAARTALTAAEWSCSGASAAPEPAARWQPAS